MTDILSIVRQLRSRMGHIWDDVTDLIIRPIRAEYRIQSLGPRVFKTSAASKSRFQREDLVIENARGMKLQCSWYGPAPDSAHLNETHQREGSSSTESRAARLPCVIYLHGNCGCRIDARDCLFLLDEGITVFTFDFAGSGLSEGEYVTLGYFERQDLLAVVDYLISTKRVSTIGLWGRSMGAVTAIMYAARDPTIAAIVCDSPFSSLKLLAHDLALLHAAWVPKLAVKGIVGQIRRKVMERAGFDIKDLDTLKYAQLCRTTPAFIFHGRDDEFVRYEHSVAVADHYAGNCIHHVVEGDHNSVRGDDVKDVAKSFLRLYLIDKPLMAASAGHSPPLPAQEAGADQQRVSQNTLMAPVTPSPTTPSATPQTLLTDPVDPDALELPAAQESSRLTRKLVTADPDQSSGSSRSSEPPDFLEED